MMKKLLFSTFLFFGISLSIANAQVRLVRTTSTATNEYIYSADDRITYASSLTGVVSVCGDVPYRVQLNTFTLNIKSTSIGRIAIGGYSTGNGTRTLANITTSSGSVVGYTTSSTITTSTTCGYILINDINIPKNPAGTDITITLAGNINMTEILLTSIETLPLKFLSFTAKPVGLGRTVNLNWKTTNEINTKNFVVERRTDAIEFVAIGTVKSKNEAGTQDYSFVDEAASQGVNYYRLKQVDNDGASTYSEIANADIKGNLSLSVFPNPATEKLNIQYALTSKPGTIKIFSVDGKSLSTTQVASGSTTTDLNISALKQGQYLLVFSDGSTQSATKFIKK